MSLENFTAGFYEIVFLDTQVSAKASMVSFFLWLLKCQVLSAYRALIGIDGGWKFTDMPAVSLRGMNGDSAAK